MKNEKYYLNIKTINQMNLNFLIKLATLTRNATVMELLKVTTDRINERLKEIDLQFSSFRYDSMVSKFQRGDKTPLTSSNDFKRIYNAAILSEQMTNGIYKPYFAGKFAPSVVVKSWAIEQVFNENLKPLLKNPEIVGVYLGTGSSMKFATRQDSSFSWEIVIPSAEDEQILTTYYLKNGAIATSTTNLTGYDLRRIKSDIKQSTVIRGSLVEASVWSLVATLSDKEEFSSFVAHYNLTGIFLDKSEQTVNFNLGNIVENAQVKA